MSWRKRGGLRTIFTLDGACHPTTAVNAYELLASGLNYSFYRVGGCTIVRLIDPVHLAWVYKPVRGGRRLVIEHPLNARPYIN
jgi:hypothetical protein